MNDKRFNSILLLAIAATLIALLLQQYLPQKRLTLLPSNTPSYFFHAGPSEDGSPAAFWVDERKLHWRCTPPRDNTTPYFPCSFNLLLTNDGLQGTDLSGYSYLNVKLRVIGKSRKIRFAMRNFNPAYSTPEDANSGKFISVNIPVGDLQGETRIELSEFKVADWWLDQLNIPRIHTQPERSNITTLGIDYAEGMEPGNYDMIIEKIEFVGEWVSAETWYLAILTAWLLGIFSYAIIHLIRLREQSRHDVQVINTLNQYTTELRRETDKFRRLSTVDPLTQAYNRFGIDQIVSTMIALNERESGAGTNPDFALILIDIDHFKRINDRRGHDTGDRVLQAVATIIAKAIGRKDYLGRWGGEEFIVLLPNKRKEFAIAMAEKIRLSIDGTLFEPDNPLAVTASFGVSDRLQGEEFNDTFKRADIALYQAKAQGRNCSVMASDRLDDH